MLYRCQALDAAEMRVLEATAGLRSRLSHHIVSEPRRWTGLLARMTRARALRASNGIEGINVSDEDAVAAVDGEDPAHADRDAWRAVVGYRQAMDFVLQRRQSASFAFSEDVLLAVHFMICQYDFDARPGRYRPGWVGVRDTRTGALVHEGVDRDALEPLVGEALDYANGEGGQPAVVKAAMVHLNLALLHPFSDGNGRTARCMQTAVLAGEGIAAPVFSSIEEYIGRNQRPYYDVLAAVGGGGWNPERDVKPWVRFCIAGHYHQARTLLRRTEELERVYGDLEVLATGRGLPERATLALLQAATAGRVRNAAYRVSAGISGNLASRDLKALVDAGLLRAEGERRGRSYAAAPPVAEIRDRARLPRDAGDPFAEGGPGNGRGPPR